MNTFKQALYPVFVGLLLGWLQTGLFFQFSFTLSSGFGTYLLITLSWLIGSAVGSTIASRWSVPLFGFLLVMVAAYAMCSLLVALLPFQTDLWPLYAGIITLIGLYPGVFFARMSAYYPARVLFFRENNGFIFGLITCTLLFLVLGRSVLWVGVICLLILLGGIQMGMSVPTSPPSEPS